LGKADASRHAPEEVDAYLEAFPDDVRSALERVRRVIRETVPDCTERVSYGIPIFRLRKDLVGMSAHEHHCSLHSTSPSLMRVMAEELEGLGVSGATIHFTPQQPLPEALIESIVRERTKESGLAV
jgi:uncharacterized protein YdhG (YjbR/CyaY superfamily)